ncbi:N-acetylmannosamine-6-phosphate 2-epimerase [Pseudomonas chlororaphis]|uniref:N-acylglucosamine-6-phosphate 2-epimerase n=1 Tax=Pseudomonas chlororaphis TaxID=587753 RepID=A0A3G7TIV4_9PSED|nr:hypothetical protein [Pseudomonas chlororaphis]AZE47013.1 N-acetylmannosamine-6-phosphate 2-epimerase [Pseudomonas chlororaphis]
MAQAACAGGTAAILANGGTDIAVIRTSVNLPIIGVVNRDYADSPVRLTATMREVDELMAAGVDMIGVEATGQHTGYPSAFRGGSSSDTRRSGGS